MKQAQLVRGHVEELVNAQSGNTPVPKATADWVGGLGAVMRDRLERVGLVAPADRADARTVARWVRTYIAGKVDASESTVCNMEQAERTLVEHMGIGKPLAAVTPADAEGYASFLRARRCTRGKVGTTMAEATVRRQLRRAKQFFAGAVDAHVLTANPFAKIKAGDVLDKTRQRYVTEGEIEALLGVCPDTDWKIVLALAYYAGLRCPSEINALTWADVNWGTKHLLVRSPKTRRDSNSGVRHVPMAPELFMLLLGAFSEAGEGATRVMARPMSKVNLRTTLYKLMDRAGIKHFGKPFQNMRCTCETNWLVAGVPEYQVSEWIGHQVQISRRHYDLVRTQYAEMITGGEKKSGAQSGALAAQNPAQQAAAGNRTHSQEEPEVMAEGELCETVRNGAAGCDVSISPTRT